MTFEPNVRVTLMTIIDTRGLLSMVILDTIYRHDVGKILSWQPRREKMHPYQK